jgi:hypothetical protein
VADAVALFADEILFAFGLACFHLVRIVFGLIFIFA